MFTFRYSINEDPVTGSAHCALAPYWASKLLSTEQQSQGQQMLAYQASARGGVLRVAVVGDRVKLAGPCITTIKSKVVV